MTQPTLVFAVCCTLQLALPIPAIGECGERLEAIGAKLAAASDLRPELRTVLGSARAKAAADCASGNETDAEATLSAIEMMLSTNAQTRELEQAYHAAKRSSEAQLTAEYLEGSWCSTGKQEDERILWFFGMDGTYKLGPNESHFHFVADGKVDEFLGGFDAVSSKQADRFVTLIRGNETVFRRGQGACRCTHFYKPMLDTSESTR